MFRRLMGLRIVELRRARGWTQDELAQRSGWSRPLLSQVERGIASVAADRLLELCEALGPGVEPGDLLPTVEAVTAHENDSALLKRRPDKRVRSRRAESDSEPR